MFEPVHGSGHIFSAMNLTATFSFFPPDRKPRPVSQLVAQQVNQQFASPTHTKKDKKEKSEKDKSDKEPTLRKKSHKKMR